MVDFRGSSSTLKRKERIKTSGEKKQTDKLDLEKWAWMNSREATSALMGRHCSQWHKCIRNDPCVTVFRRSADVRFYFYRHKNSHADDFTFLLLWFRVVFSHTASCWCVSDQTIETHVRATALSHPPSQPETIERQPLVCNGALCWSQRQNKTRKLKKSRHSYSFSKLDFMLVLQSNKCRPERNFFYLQLCVCVYSYEHGILMIQRLLKLGYLI